MWEAMGTGKGVRMGGQELFNLAAGEVVSAICHFVQFLW